MRILSFLCVLVLCGISLKAQVGIYDSGGPIMPEQGAYDVTFYDLDVRVYPDERSIEGKVLIQADVVHPMNELVVDLDTTLRIVRATEGDVSCPVIRNEGKVHVQLGRTRQRGEVVRIVVHYEGKPRVAPRAPWDGGFDWKKTPSGAHWIATSCQTEGADLWWPNKDHVSDEPDSMAIHVRVPDPLVVASNGRLRDTEAHDDGTTTYHWFVSTPINNYNVALNIAPYRTIEEEMESVTGETFPVVFYVLPEDYEKGKEFFPQIIEHLTFFEKYLGPYPFRADKYGVAQTPHLGMEHQTIIAYGAGFRNDAMTGRDWGFDALHHHELAHEWWGNLVTNSDWKDMWIHEGFGSYMQALYIEELSGAEEYQAYMLRSRFFSDQLPIAPSEGKSSEQIYQAPIYTKGAWVLHTLRYLIGDEDFFAALRKMTYPTEELAQATDGSQCRFVATKDFILICEDVSGMDLGWFFDAYVRQAEIPTMNSRVADNTLTLAWEMPEGMDFPMPIDVEIDGEIRRVNVPATIDLPAGSKPVVDPNNWVLLQLKR